MFTIHISGTHKKYHWSYCTSFEALYDELSCGNEKALYFYYNGWHRIEKYHIVSDLPATCMDVYWRDKPENFDIWKQDHLVSVLFGTGNELIWYVRNFETRLQQIFDRTCEWAFTNGLECEGVMFDKETNLRLDISQMLLDIYTIKFQIKHTVFDK